MLEYIVLYTGGMIEKSFFETRLRELRQEEWSLKDISELNTDHIDCDLTFATISAKTCKQYYESNKNSCITVEAYFKLI